jgi:hypothetical protein
MASITHKRGDTFRFAAVLRESKTGPVIDLGGWVIASMIRAADTDALIAELTVTVTNAAQGAFTLRADDTDAWPVGTAYWDIQYTDPGTVIQSTETISVQILEDVTYPDPAPAP